VTDADNPATPATAGVPSTPATPATAGVSATPATPGRSAKSPMTEAGGEKDRIVGLLADEWGIIADLLGQLPEDAWSRQVLPEWTVHDVVAHLVGGERMLSGEARPDTSPDSTTGPHIRNEIGRLNEAWVVSLRKCSHAELLEQFRAVTHERRATLEGMSQSDFDAPSWTPMGNATYGRFMEIRVFDAWMHEQDIRAAVEMPGNESGPVAEQALAEVIRALGYIVGKLARAPERSSITVVLTGPIESKIHVEVTARAHVVTSLPGSATASVAMGSSLFLRLAGGRMDPDAALAQIDLSGDLALARQVATHLAYTI